MRDKQKDPSRGYQKAATAFIQVRDRSQIGMASVRAWARSLPSGASVLDLGCGSGVPLAHVLLEEGLEVFGVDAAPAMVNAFNQRFPQARVVCEPVETSAFFDRTFDAVLAWGLLFLLPPSAQREVIPRVAGALKPGGRFLFTAPAQTCTWVDVLSGRRSVSLGAEQYARLLADAELDLLGEYDDEGGNHYFDAIKRIESRE